MDVFIFADSIDQDVTLLVGTLARLHSGWGVPSDGVHTTIDALSRVCRVSC